MPELLCFVSHFLVTLNFWAFLTQEILPVDTLIVYIFLTLTVSVIFYLFQSMKCYALALHRNCRLYWVYKAPDFDFGHVHVDIVMMHDESAQRTNFIVSLILLRSLKW